MNLTKKKFNMNTIFNYVKQHKVFVGLLVLIVVTAIGSYLLFNQQIEKIATGFFADLSPLKTNGLQKLSWFEGPTEEKEILAKIKYAPGELIIKFSSETKEVIGRMLRPGFTQDWPEKNRFQQAIDFNANFVLSEINKLRAKGINTDLLEKTNAKYKAKIIPVFKGLHRQLNFPQNQGKDFYRLEAEKRPREKAQLEGLPDLSAVYLLKITGEVEEALRDYNQLKDIFEYVEPNYIATIQDFPKTLPNDTYVNPSRDGLTWSTGAWGQDYEDMWGLKKIEANRAWPLSQGEGVVVSVVDTGIDYIHEDITENIWINEDEIPDNGIDDDGNGYIDDVKGWDFANDDNDPRDDHGHGTHVAGTIAAVGNNEKGIIGLAPRAKVMAVKGLRRDGSGTNSDLAEALYYAARNDAKVINNSWGGVGSSELITEAVDYAHGLGAVVVAAAGNCNFDTRYFYPANLKKVITVSSVDHYDNKSDFSNWGGEDRCICSWWR